MTGLLRRRTAAVREEQAISTLVFHVGREMRTALDRRLTEHGLTSQQAALLLLSRLLKEPSPNKMAERLGTDTAGMTRLLDRLESKGLIMRKVSPKDRRSLVVVLGPRSRSVLPRLVPEFKHVNRGLLDGFDDRERQQLHEMLKRLLKNAVQLSGRPEMPDRPEIPDRPDRPEMPRRRGID